MDKIEKGRMLKLYRVFLPVGRDVILLLTHETNGSIETPVTVKLMHTVLFVPFLT